MIDKQRITGLVLAGGLGTRMGGLDKGLVAHRGEPLARHATTRLAPQVGRVAINANRNRLRYQALGGDVWPDAVAGFPGPLAGMLAGLSRCDTPFLVTVPCDSPRFPLDLVARLSHALVGADADVAVASTTEPAGPRLQPVFCLMRVEVRASLAAFLQSGQRQIAAWSAGQRRVEVPFTDLDAFANLNTHAELERLDASA